MQLVLICDVCFQCSMRSNQRCLTRIANVIGSNMLVVPVFIELSLEDQVISNFVRLALSIPHCSCLNQLLKNVTCVRYQGSQSICWYDIAIVRLSSNCITNCYYYYFYSIFVNRLRSCEHISKVLALKYQKKSRRRGLKMICIK